MKKTFFAASATVLVMALSGCVDPLTQPPVLVGNGSGIATLPDSEQVVADAVAQLAAEEAAAAEVAAAEEAAAAAAAAEAAAGPQPNPLLQLLINQAIVSSIAPATEIQTNNLQRSIQLAVIENALTRLDAAPAAAVAAAPAAAAAAPSPVVSALVEGATGAAAAAAAAAGAAAPGLTLTAPILGGVGLTLQ